MKGCSLSGKVPTTYNWLLCSQNFLLPFNHCPEKPIISIGWQKHIKCVCVCVCVCVFVCVCVWPVDGQLPDLATQEASNLKEQYI